MSYLEQEEQLIDQAMDGNGAALGTLLESVQDMVFNLSLRMLGMIPDAEDATQEILLKVMTKLAAFRRESAFSTWVYRIAVNHLKDYRKGLMANNALSFEVYGEDIASGREKDMPDLSGGVDRNLLEQELKLSCTNVMLQCLDGESRCIYILGTMFRMDSRMAAGLLDMTPEAYRQRLSRIRRKMGEFLKEYCGLSGTGQCKCVRRIDYAVATHRLSPKMPGFRNLKPCSHEELLQCMEAMESLDEMSQIFADMPAYRISEGLAEKFHCLLRSDAFAAATGEAGSV